MAAEVATDTCLCDTTKYFFWDAVTRSCKCRTGFTLTNGTCKCASGFFLNTLDNCITCVGLAGLSSPISSINNICKCDSAKKFVWDPEHKKCVCLNTFYQTASGTCGNCADMVGAAKPASSANGECACNDTNNFEWNPSSKSCSCKIKFYKTVNTCTACPTSKTTDGCSCRVDKYQQFFNGSCICAPGYFKKGSVCLACSDLSGIAADASSTNLGCNCDISLNYVWSNTTYQCVCKLGFILDSSGICLSCASIPGALNTTNSSSACNCKPNFKWSAVEEACLCAPNYYLTASMSCAVCSALPGVASPTA